MTYTAHEIHGGYYETYKCVEVGARLHYMPYAQAGWRVFGDIHKTMEMFSYSSRIFTAKFDETGVAEIHTMEADAAINYSRTTSRQVTAAMRELGLNGNEIAALKKFFANGGEIAIVTHDGKQWVNGDNTSEVIC